MDMYMFEGEEMKTTIELALEAGWDDHHAEFDTRIDRLVALVRADEREACAKVAEDKGAMVIALLNVTSQPIAIAAAIRARGNT
jgi:hypothetical protein